LISSCTIAPPTDRIVRASLSFAIVRTARPSSVLSCWAATTLIDTGSATRHASRTMIFMSGAPAARARRARSSERRSASAWGWGSPRIEKDDDRRRADRCVVSGERELTGPTVDAETRDGVGPLVAREQKAARRIDVEAPGIVASSPLFAAERQRTV